MDQEQIDVAEKKKILQSQFSIPFAIVIAGIIVGAAIVYAFGGMRQNNYQQTAVVPTQTPPAATQVPDNVQPVSSTDHIRGNPNAPVVIVEFSDLECPFCKRFQATMQQVMTTYGDKVAWVYRHYPIPQLHPKAPHEAVAAECANSQGGNDIFWKYVDKVFEVTPSNNGLDPAMLDTIAQQLGLDMKKFDACLSSTAYDQLIQSESQDAVNSGAQGTPYSIVISSKGKKAIDGAYPFDYVKSVIDSLL